MLTGSHVFTGSSRCPLVGRASIRAIRNEISAGTCSPTQGHYGHPGSRSGTKQEHGRMLKQSFIKTSTHQQRSFDLLFSGPAHNSVQV
jgi:hypothetical protein